MRDTLERRLYDRAASETTASCVNSKASPYPVWSLRHAAVAYWRQRERAGDGVHAAATALGAHTKRKYDEVADLRSRPSAAIGSYRR